MSEENSCKVKAEDPNAVTNEMRKQLEEEFNGQRAKMKELFLQKEELLKKMKEEKEELQSEILGLREELNQLQTLSQNQKSEIQSLQLLVHETIEASSSGSEELRHLWSRNVELEQQLTQFKQQHAQQEMSLAPATLVRQLARKLGADSETDTPTRKCHEESNSDELIKSIVEPLELEITALKNKLRETDAQLQEMLKSKAVDSGSVITTDAKTDTDGGGARACDMCANYERELQREMRRSANAEERVAAHAHALRLATEELEGVRSTHEDTISAWHAERAQCSRTLGELADEQRAIREQLNERQAAAEAASHRALHLVTTLTVDRETLQRKLDSLEHDNAMLRGQFIKKALEMQNEIINLPNTVEELQEHALKLREQLIVSEMGREAAEGGAAELRRQLAASSRACDELHAELHELRAHCDELRSSKERMSAECEQLQQIADQLRTKTEALEASEADKRRLQAELLETRARVAALQRDLDNSEKVQQDFVRLSQSLQVQLERIREAETEVRWQHDEDVSECGACRAPLPTQRSKVHCRHCGRIFCAPCVRHVVACGPRAAPARVCAVCRTLLQPDAPPYFSTEPPRGDI